MRRFGFISIHPSFIDAYCQFGVFRSAVKTGISFSAINLRNFAVDKHGSIDESPFGGGDGMVLRPEPLAAAVRSFSPSPKVFVTSPSGRPWTQKDAQHYAEIPDDLIFVSGRFAGIDQRFLDEFVSEDISLGDFVISGGELPSLMIADSILRLIPGVLGNAQSPKDDSFGSGMPGLLEYPLYTRPLEFEGKRVPEVLLSGDHAAIAKWRRVESLAKTTRLRPDLIKPSK